MPFSPICDINFAKTLSRKENRTVLGETTYEKYCTNSVCDQRLLGKKKISENHKERSLDPVCDQRILGEEEVPEGQKKHCHDSVCDQRILGEEEISEVQE